MFSMISLGNIGERLANPARDVADLRAGTGPS